MSVCVGEVEEEEKEEEEVCVLSSNLLALMLTCSGCRCRYPLLRLQNVGEKAYVRRLLAVVLPDFSGPKSERTEGECQRCYSHSICARVQF